MEYCLLILNCKKYDYKRHIQRNTWLKSFPLQNWFHIIGDTSIDTEYLIDEANKLITVNVPDDYISLPKKTFMGIKAISERFPDIKYILKTDDDVVCNIDEFLKILNVIPEYDYGGYERHIYENMLSTHHYHSSEVKESKLVLACVYCSGSFYFLSKRAINHILTKKDDFWNYIYEDNVVGYALKSMSDLRIVNIPLESIFKLTEPSQPVVSVNIMGGLGNQMFQLATAYAYARKYGGILKVLRNKLMNDRRPLYWDSILNNFNKYLVDSIPSNLVQWYESGATEYCDIPPLTSNGAYLNGYLQSSLYFGDEKIQNEIKELFRPSHELFDSVYKKYKPLIENKDRVVVVHARRTDYLRNQDIINFHGPLTVEYYKETIKQISKEVKNPIFLLASDDSSFWISICNDIPELSEHNVYVLDGENEINTLVLLQQFKYFIIANSTFSWWAVWMSDSKIVYAPSKWFGPTGPKNYKDIYVPSWRLI